VDATTIRHCAVDRPRRLLRGFTRVGLAPGETRVVTLSCAADVLRWYNPQTGAWELEAMPYKLFIGTSRRDVDLLVGAVTLPA
jgi:beta-glucosidase